VVGPAQVEGFQIVSVVEVARFGVEYVCEQAAAVENRIDEQGILHRIAEEGRQGVLPVELRGMEVDLPASLVVRIAGSGKGAVLDKVVERKAIAAGRALEAVETAVLAEEVGRSQEGN
jgi:hypothetical protein